ncbi:hypothetical protein A2870_03570 [Candidatus Curtissbacteria bacterium RIFCSPHIGHO2_01_FULL_41_11]|uniref:Uncharacterized protein n=1 Tax=Candidatus Curtissbacteria bacterium RIFCSPHIGHO2_01_FULL_41_11 TaxID=1797711 RepID=A0A1F5G5R6_9BACT|nr:MAG: hypothetical protein A2870_03570 [Candidatus Curtissbacteria bacterium RIFCSPHIGHO2_01_FULL_41_11]
MKEERDNSKDGLTDGAKKLFADLIEWGETEAIPELKPYVHDFADLLEREIIVLGLSEDHSDQFLLVGVGDSKDIKTGKTKIYIAVHPRYGQMNLHALGYASQSDLKAAFGMLIAHTLDLYEDLKDEGVNL